MSFAALAWVMDSAPCPTSQTFAALIVFASFANEDGRSYPSTETVAAKSRQNQKTVRAAIATLQLHGLLVDTGRRVGRTGNVRVYALGMEGLPEVGTLKGEVAPDAPEAEQEAATGAQGEALPETGGLEDAAKVPVSGPKPTRKRVAEPIKEPVPLEEANASSAPQGAETISAAPCSKASKGRSEGWTVPPIASLPPEVQAIARQWPAGAYETHGAGHAAHLAGRRRVHNPDRTWHSRIVQLSEQPLRAAKAGLRYASPASAPTAAPKPAAPAVTAHDPNGEGPAAIALRQALRDTGGEVLYQQWLEPCRYDVGDEQLIVTAPSNFLGAYVRSHFGHRIEAQAQRLIGAHATVGWEVQLPA